MTEQTATRKQDNGNVGPCACASFTNIATGQHTGCTSETARTFAPGHDAKLKSLLIAAGAKGQKVHALGEGEDGFDAQVIADRFGFAAKVREGIYNARKNSKGTETPAAPVKAAKSRGTTFVAVYGDITETRTSKTRTYTHAAVYKIGTKTVIGSWHSTEALAAKGQNTRYWGKPIAVVAVTVAN